MVLFFALTMFVSAALMFVLQPLVGRMLLPRVGGSPAVWNACLVFFQAVLLLGYAYTHGITRWLGVRGVLWIHLGLLFAPLLVLPIYLDPALSPEIASPVRWLLRTLLVLVGLPFFVISTTAPMLQRWFAATSHRFAGDPYFLYAASNFGSLLALVAYPLVIEPYLSLREQADIWRWVYLGYACLGSICALLALVTFPRQQSLASETAGQTPPLAATDAVAPGPIAKVASAPTRWVVLGFIPSSLLLGVTTHLTTDLTPIPLLWVLPLGLYLLTFVLAFSPRLTLPLRLSSRLLAITLLALTITLLLHATDPIWALIVVHLVTFFFAAMLCHTLLAEARPRTDKLTAFYLWMSFGGVLGGVFNALVAPIVFHRLGYVEYPLMLVAVAMLRQWVPNRVIQRNPWFAGRAVIVLDVLLPLALGGLVAGAVVYAGKHLAFQEWLESVARSSGFPLHVIRGATCFGIPCILAYTFVERPIRFALALGCLFLAGSLDPGPMGHSLFLERNSLGVIRVTQDAEGRFMRMVHGNTIHGMERIHPKPREIVSRLQLLGSSAPLAAVLTLNAGDDLWSRPHEPLTYYHPTGPAGELFRQLIRREARFQRIGLVGLGVGSLASYARPDQHWIFWELDPAVIRLARDARYFHFLRDCRAHSLELIAGDARINLQRQEDASFDVLVLDAFSSDAIPMHLLTAEAVELYARKLRPGGLLLFHISNRYLQLTPILGKLAESVTPRWLARVCEDLAVSDMEKADGKFPSLWLVMVRDPRHLGRLATSGAWQTVRVAPTTPRWTDDHANFLDAARFFTTDE